MRRRVRPVGTARHGTPRYLVSPVGATPGAEKVGEGGGARPDHADGRVGRVGVGDEHAVGQALLVGGVARRVVDARVDDADVVLAASVEGGDKGAHFLRRVPHLQGISLFA